MQEEVEHKTLTLVVNSARWTGRTLKEAITKYLAYLRSVQGQKRQNRNNPVIHHGKQTVRQLIGQNQGVSNVELNDPSIRAFDRIARKYGVDFAVKRDRSSDPPRFLIFFKSRDADALTAAMQEYAGQKVRQASRPSVLQRLAQFKERVKAAAVRREKRKELER